MYKASKDFHPKVVNISSQMLTNVAIDNVKDENNSKFGNISFHLRNFSLTNS